MPTEDDAQASAAFRAKEKQGKAAAVAGAEPAPSAKELDIANAAVALPEVPLDALPHCPTCRVGLLRPGVVWFGEALPSKTMETVHQWMDDGPVDLMLVIGTSSKVYPAAGYSMAARARGARVAVINLDRADEASGGMMAGDWFFQGDAAVVVPEILKSVVGNVGPPNKI